MKVLMINKFLHANGGSETYIFKLGEYLSARGHEVQYFGMEHKERKVGNRVNAYTSNMDFHSGSKIAKVLYPIKTIYSMEARKKIRMVLDNFKPDVCHLNNFNYQLTPSIILEIRKWEKQTKHRCKILYTAHDYQLICPNHMCNNPNTHENCEACLGGKFINCTKNKCIHGSIAKSFIGTLEAIIWNMQGVYRQIDTIICCSGFMKNKLDTNPIFKNKTITLHNFIEKVQKREAVKKDYVLYFGRFSWEKGVRTLIEACSMLPEIPFIFAGKGEYETEMSKVPNIQNVGFKSGEELETLIREARFSVCPSEWYENCPFSVMESQMYGTPVLGAEIGGIPELIGDGIDGKLFTSGDAKDLANKILEMWNDREKMNQYQKECSNIVRDSLEEYYEKVMHIYSK